MRIDWQSVFVPGGSLIEIVLRGSVIYLALFLMMRFILKREAGTVGMADLLMVVLVADAAQNAMARDYKSITEGLVLVGTIVFWNYALDWLGYHSQAFEWLVHPPPLPLVKAGRMLRRNMRQEMVTEDELMSHLRQQGVDDVSAVKMAYMEGDGRISVVTYEPQGGNKDSKQALG